MKYIEISTDESGQPVDFVLDYAAIAPREVEHFGDLPDWDPRLDAIMWIAEDFLLYQFIEN